MSDYRSIRENDLILGENQYYSTNSIRTGLSNHVLCVGGSGTGKTRSIVCPNILQASGSYIISDPKGNLYDKYAKYLKGKGYVVRKLNFAEPADPDSCHYNFLRYVRTEQDVLEVAHMLVHACYEEGEAAYRMDPFWDQASELLLQAIIGYIVFYCPEEDQTLSVALRLIRACSVSEDDADWVSETDRLFNSLQIEEGDVFPVRRYNEFRLAAARTLKSILITTTGKLGRFDTEETKALLSRDDVDMPSIGVRKTAFFVIVSDSDRSMDMLANIFFSQCIKELSNYADTKCRNQRLPVAVRFILDDFATNVRIADFPRIISSIRSRDMSVMLMVQAESQLRSAYRDDCTTIISNCDSYVYLGGNDLETCRHIAERCDKPLEEILYMPVHQCIIFRRGSKPVFAKTIDLEEFTDFKLREQINDKSTEQLLS